MARLRIRAAGYVRISTELQEDSPKQQRAEIRKLAKREGCQIVAWYEDRGITGDSTDARPEFCRLLEDAQAGKFAVIVCDNQDRFGRFDSIDAGAVISPLRSAGVRMLTNAQGWIDWNDFATRMIFAVQQEGKNQFLYDLSRNITRSFANSDDASTFIRSAPLGMCRVFYDQQGREQVRVGAYEEFKKPKGWSVRVAPTSDKAERDSMIWAFKTYANGTVGLGPICRGLEERGVVSRAGTRLFPECLRNLFRNKKYIGIVEAGIFAKGKYHRIDADGNVAPARDVPITRSDQRRGRSVREFVDAGEPLISRELFESVQRKLRKRATVISKPRPTKYVLTGVLRCGECGGRMYGEAASKNNTIQAGYYRCNGPRTGGCEGHRVRRDLMDDCVFELLQRVVFSPDVARQLKLLGAPKNRQRVRTRSEKRLTKQLAVVEAKLERARRNFAIAEQDDLPTMKTVLQELKQERAQLLSDLDASEVDDPKTVLAEAVAAVDNSQRWFSDPKQRSNHAALKAALADTFDTITLWFGDGRHRHVARGEAVIKGFPRISKLRCEYGVIDCRLTKVTLLPASKSRTDDGSKIGNVTPLSAAVCTVPVFEASKVATVSNVSRMSTIAPELGATPSAATPKMSNGV